ncbi:hypothetical protein Caci_8014 [Catenulispora acidiphila DSM 44928]|uniref:Uncharacterized protein n=1 Tax=Catenulispora acidiphila (strain DSM 44928 / JCM 14897 / NBRC 102108 / NRRL B-24433 / ID139908) TaxID=479433 RepID=C7QGY7_CATAD|nr:DUF2142 domain-containing protein [Catenulispora acidiphila]ACU76837.1 hypothetical protein Caci_8014 [Catenulispora acidiphila DSM 44928]
MSPTVPARQHRSPLHRSPLHRTWRTAFAAFALLAAAWSLAMPPDGTTDERQHIERAYGAVTGHLLAPQGEDPLVHRPGAAFEVPKSLLPPNALCVYFPNLHQDQSWVARSATCQEPAPATHAKTRVVSWVGRYNPLYYLAVGAPLRFWPTTTGIVLSRILAALLASAFAATAATIAIRTRRPLLLAALLTVLTPTTIALNATVNPNGIEISAALLLWVCLVDLARATSAVSANAGSAARSVVGGVLRRSRLRRGAAAEAEAARVRLMRRASAAAEADSVASDARLRDAWEAYFDAGAARMRRAMEVDPDSPAISEHTFSQPALLLLAAISGAVVLTVRAEGPFWFALAVGGSLAVAERGRLQELLRWRAARLVAAAWAVVGALGMAWNVVSGNDKVTHTLIAVHLADHRVSTLLRLIAVNRVGGWFSEAFALDVQASWVPMLWAALSAAVLIPLAMLRSRRVVVVALAVAAASLGITVLLEIKFLGTLGWSQYGRYFLPGLAGTAVLLASGNAAELPSVLQRRIPRLFALGAAFCQLWVLAVEMTRVQAGPNAPVNPFGGSWHPAVGSLTVLGVAVLGAAGLIALVWVATATAAPPPTPAVPLSLPAPAPAATAPDGSRVVPEPANS